MAWVKRSVPTEPLPAAPETAPEQSAEIPENVEKPAKTSSRRYNKAGQRRGERQGMAVLGLIVLIFAVIGVFSSLLFGIRIVKNARDTSHLKEEMYYTLRPLMQYAPTAFETAHNSEQDTLIQSALYVITNREWIRQQQDSNYITPYSTDEFGRTVVPIADVNAAYAQLYGKNATPNCHTFGDDASTYFTYEYDAEKQVYYVPFSSVSSSYEPLIDTIRRAGDIYTVRVGYVHLQDITIDDYGNRVVDLAKATYFQLYTVERLEDESFIIRSVKDEETITK